MLYKKNFKLKDGREVLLRNAEATDGAAVLQVFRTAHEETDYLLTYPDESSFTVVQESDYLQHKADSKTEAEIAAWLDGEIVGTAGIERTGQHDKIRHRAEFGINILRKYWGIGLGSVLAQACIECAQQAGYTQLELSVVENNSRAVKLYKKFGFSEFGRNPRGFLTRDGRYQTLVLMRLELQ